MTNRKMEPLSLPEELEEPSSLQVMLADLPFVGLAARIRRSLAGQLKARPAEAMNVWDLGPEAHRVRDRVSQRVRDVLEWPNDRFIPADPCRLVSRELSVGLGDIELVMWLEDEYAIPETVTERICGNLTYGELIAELARTANNRPSDS